MTLKDILILHLGELWYKFKQELIYIAKKWFDLQNWILDRI